ncbi:MAG: class I SAM-dependent methyltransferase [Vicinamibacterales bacterium]
MTSAARQIAVEEVPCPACDGTQAVAIASGPDYDCHCCGDQVFRLVQCRACGTYYLNPRPTVEMLPVIYAREDYYSYSFEEEGNPVVLRARARRDRGKVRQVLATQRRAVRDLRVLDVGAGDGSLLRAFGAAGVPAAHLTGLELDPQAVEALERRGMRGVLGRAEDATFDAGSVDVCTLIQVIEHVAAPRDVLRRMFGALAPGGACLLETPNMDGWDRRFFAGGDWGGYHFPRHWTLFDPHSLSRLLHDIGFEVVHVSTPAAAVVWAWSLNHVAQRRGWPPAVQRFFSMDNPLALGACLALELLPSALGRSSNMRIIAIKPGSGA